MKTVLFFFSVLIAGTAAAAERIACTVTADAWIAMPPFEVLSAPKNDGYDNHGADPQLVIRGRESFALLNFACTGAAGLTIEKATLRVHREASPAPLHTVGLSTVSGNGPWEEGAVNFYWARAAKQSWSYPGSQLVDVTFGPGGSLYAYPRAKDAGGGWYEIDVPPALVAAVLTGDQYGLMLCDEKGQTQTRHVLGSRESSTPPELTLEGTRADSSAPGAARSFKKGGDSTPEEARSLGRSTLRPGSVILRFGGAGDDAGRGVATRYELKYGPAPVDAKNFETATPAPRWFLNPLAPKPHPLAASNALRDEVTAVVEQLKPGERYYFAARAIDEAGNKGPVSPLGSFRAYQRSFPSLPPAAARAAQPGGANPEPRVWAVPELLKINPRTGALLEQAEFPEHRARNTVWDAAAGKVTLKGARNEFVAFQIAVESPQPVHGLEVTVSRPVFGGSKLPRVFEKTGAIQIYREWFVPDEKGLGWYPDALIPAGGPVDLPAKDNGVPEQRVQPFFVDVYIPHDARPGKHTAELLVRAEGLRRQVMVEVEVLPLTLPDELSFVVDLNCYSGVDSGFPATRGTPEYRAIEHAYHRVAHLHRTNLDVLGYSHNGTTVADHAPPLTGEGAATRVADWKDWDAHFGPLADGSAFADLPRASAPAPAMYLAFFENWPGDLRRSYKFNNYPVAKTEEEYRDIVTRHTLEALPVEESFSQEYQDRFSAVAADFARHLRERKWTKTRYLVYFNNKYYYKRPSQGGQGVSWWLLDEPNHRDDIRANSFLAYLLKRGLKDYPDVPIILRTDISRVEWIRDLMAGQIDLNCISPRFYEKNRLLRDDLTRFGREIWNYSSTNHPRDTNVAMRAWCWRAWLAGGGGLLPWNAVRGPSAWTRAEPLTVFYAGSKFGREEPFASLRLKAYRRGQQDVEYLALLARKRGWDRDAVSRAAGAALDLSAEVRQQFEEDAGVIRFLKVKDSDLDALRERVIQALIAR